MNRKKFLAAFGVLAGATMTGLGKPVPGEKAFNYSDLQGNESDIWKTVREEFSFPEGFVYLNTGGIGSVPRHVRSLVSDEWFQLEANPSPGHDLNRWNALKKNVATLLGPGVDASEIALISSATEGINIILNGLPLQKGDEIITTQHEHAALNITLLNQVKRKGVVIRTFDPDRKIGINNVKMIKDLINKKTKLIFVSHRTTTTGQLLPVREIGNLANSEGIWFALDGAQAPGSMPIDVKEWHADFYTFSSHKWVLAPRRTGVLYVANEKLDVVAPVTVGAYSDNGFNLKEGKLNFQSSAQRYEYGTQNPLLFYGFHASLNFLNTIGIQKIREHNETLSEKFYSEISETEGCELLSPAEREYRSSMITFRIPGKSLNDVMGVFAKDNLHVRPVGEADLQGVRVSFHIYNSENDLNKAIECIKKIVKT